MVGLGLIAVTFSCTMYILAKRGNWREIPEDWFWVAGAGIVTVVIGVFA